MARALEDFVSKYLAATDRIAELEDRAVKAEAKLARIAELRRYKGPRADGWTNTSGEALRELVAGLDAILADNEGDQRG